MRKRIGRLRPWQKASTSSITGPKFHSVPKLKWEDVTVSPQVMYQQAPHVVSYPPPPPHVVSGYHHVPHHPPPPHYHSQPPPHHVHPHPPPAHSHPKHHHKEEHHQHHHNEGHKNYHKGPPPPPGFAKRFFDYIFDTLKKRPILYSIIFANVAFFFHRKFMPESHQKFISELRNTAKKNNYINGNEKLKVTKFRDSMQNYSSSFKKAAYGADAVLADEILLSSSILTHLKEVVDNLPTNKKQEISRLTESFNRDNMTLNSALGSTVSKLRHCQLLGMTCRSEAEEKGEGAASNQVSHETIKSLQTRIDELCQKKFELEYDFIQLICEVLDQSERDKLCRALMKNNASSVPQYLSTPLLYPEITGLSCTKRAVYVLRFDGNLTASGVSSLRHEVTAIVENADKSRGDRVVVVLSSSGGTVGGYGLGASQLERIKDAGLHLTVCVDEVAASGGYLMACVADTLVTAPFATLGSIGVMAMIPNFHERLEREGIHVDTVTAGTHKVTLSPTSKSTFEKRQKIQEELDNTHKIFKDHISKYRPEVDIERVSTGETWLGTDAIKLGLCDSISTSDDHILQLSKVEGTEIYNVRYNSSDKKKMWQKLLQEDDACANGAVDATTYAASVLSRLITETASRVMGQNVSASAKER